MPEIQDEKPVTVKVESEGTTFNINIKIEREVKPRKPRTATPGQGDLLKHRLINKLNKRDYKRWCRMNQRR